MEIAVQASDDNVDENLCRASVPFYPERISMERKGCIFFSIVTDILWLINRLPSSRRFLWFYGDSSLIYATGYHENSQIDKRGCFGGSKSSFYEMKFGYFLHLFDVFGSG